ncbi:MAG: dihydrolipoamide acyltransferase [Betaproteobacteria bacterium]|jgi:pyruvate/2-oxoglutarate dehydrogenase complex dihydrolipoamide acyltransferase (E2) component|uniref:Dihydrolipoamide acyltransferase n=1 Tax=Candidatus Proximibacter danicus TaxID=2954365 RepID=A0A9D7PQ67_9PROT|nr:dihydrolipoamide acyltransferase [Candidatus Proximibacter danicus]MBK9447647.1 dihydrolipoamide acyltransferase [Betaproteobacteria bacterium]
MAVEIRMPKYPECWSSCGSCASGDVFILEVFVQPGEHIEREDNIISIETGKVALDIPSPWSGTVVEVFVEVGDKPEEGALLITLERDTA